MNTNKIFLLFGSSGDLGKIAVEYFLNQDYNKYYFFARREFPIDKKGKDVEIIQTGDLSVEENVMTAFSKVIKNINSEYYLFSTIGGFIGGKLIAETTYEDWSNMMNINLNTAFLIAKNFSKLIEGTMGGSICFTSALSSLKAESGKSAYNISKNGLNFLVKTLALEGKNIGLSANAVAPYIIDSVENRSWVKDEKLLIKPHDICSTVQKLFDNKSCMSGNIIEMPFGLWFRHKNQMIFISYC